MTRQTNIELFDEITAKIFAITYESFPIPKSIDCLKLTGCEKIDLYGRASHESDICVATLKWLQESGYISISSMAQYGANNVVLTAKGLTTLKQMPESVQEETTLGEQIMRMIKSGAISSAVELAKIAIAIKT